MKTYSPKKADIVSDWHLIDADGQVLGRLAVRVAALLRGKHKPTYAPHMDGGDHVVVVNADKVVVTGNKAIQKNYNRHSGYPGGLKRNGFTQMIKTKPERVIEHAVKGMLPHTALGRQMYKKLRVYRGPNHPHAGQVRPATRDIAEPRATPTVAVETRPAAPAAPPPLVAEETRPTTPVTAEPQSTTGTTEQTRPAAPAAEERRPDAPTTGE
jgi:large subunit ribosomal protein L13